MKNELVQLVSKKPRACLCVILVTATTATDKAVVSCREGVEAGLGASARMGSWSSLASLTGLSAPSICEGLEGEAEAGVASKSFNQLILPEGKVYLDTSPIGILFGCGHVTL